MVRIRLKRAGKKNKPHYIIVVIEKKNSQNGEFIEKLGYLNSINLKNTNNKITINEKRLNFWIEKGANVTKRINLLIKKNKH